MNSGKAIMKMRLEEIFTPVWLKGSKPLFLDLLSPACIHLEQKLYLRQPMHQVSLPTEKASSSSHKVSHVIGNSSKPIQLEETNTQCRSKLFQKKRKVPFLLQIAIHYWIFIMIHLKISVIKKNP